MQHVKNRGNFPISSQGDSGIILRIAADHDHPVSIFRKGWRDIAAAVDVPPPPPPYRYMLGSHALSFVRYRDLISILLHLPVTEK
jgi:hypothetical protein